MSVIQSSGVSAIQGLLKYGRTVGTFRIVRYIMGVCFSGVSVKRGSTVFRNSIHKTNHQVYLRNRFTPMTILAI